MEDQQALGKGIEKLMCFELVLLEKKTLEGKWHKQHIWKLSWELRCSARISWRSSGWPARSVSAAEEGAWKDNRKVAGGVQGD